jgi:hypothetical protein
MDAVRTPFPASVHGSAASNAPDGRQTRLNDVEVARHGLGAAVLDGSAWTLLGGPEPGLFVSDDVEILALP